MYVLKAFADSHPLNRFSSVVYTTLRKPELCDQVMKQFVADFQRNPPSVTKPRFWASMAETLKEYWHRQHFGINEPKNMKWQLPRLREVLSELEVVRLIYEDQFRRLAEQRFSLVYQEGCGVHPLKSYALRLLNLGFQDLDSEKYHGYLDSQQQRKRERECWVPRIRPSPQLERAVIVAGRNHVYGDYGLLEALEERGIRIHIEVDYKEFIANAI